VSTQGLRGGATHRAVGFLDPLFLVSEQLRSGSFGLDLRVWMRCQMSDHVIVKSRRNIARDINTGNP
jgi:hypothetical protein